MTSKIEPLAWVTLEQAGLAVDRVFGNVWAEGKEAPLRAVNVAAKTASVAALGVTSGSSAYEQLVEAGADHVASSLTEFPHWLAALADVR